uniref:Uncharacterized protein n=1 Tax=Arundo donax TaxID=35708 RepID=A0A0A8XPQ1_ARUDO
MQTSRIFLKSQYLIGCFFLNEHAHLHVMKLEAH